MLFKDDIVTSIFFVTKKNLSCCPENSITVASERNESGRIQHHLLNICHSALLLDVYKEAYPME